MRVGMVVRRGMAAASVLIGVLLLAPLLIDWSRYKDALSAKVESATGRVLAIDGEVSVRFLPLPTLTARGGRFSNLPGSERPDMVRFEEAVVRVSLLPLLGGVLQVETVRLVRPEIHLETLPDGRANWRFEKPAAGESRPARVASPGDGDGGGTGKGGGEVDVRLDSVLIEDGTVSRRDGTGRVVQLTGIDAEIAAETLRGPYNTRGELTVRDLRLGFDVTVDSLAEDRASQVDAAFTLAKQQARAHFRGLLSSLADRPQARGKFGLEGQSLSVVANTFGLPGGQGAFERPFSIKGTLTATPERASLDDIVAQLSATEIAGRASVAFGTVPEIEAALRTASLDLDAWLAKPDASRRTSPVRGLKLAKSQISSPEKGDNEREAETAAPFELPVDVNVTLDVDADSLAYRGGVARGVRASVALAGGELTVNQVSARLPGEADVAVFGFLSAKDGKPHADLTVDVSSGDLRGFLGWLGVGVGDVPGDRLRHGRIEGSLVGTPEEFQVTGIKGTLDGARMTGAAKVRPGNHPGGRPMVAANLAFDVLNLDAYASKGGGKPPETPVAPASAKEAAPEARPAPTHPPAGFLGLLDANLRARAGSVEVGGVTLGEVTVDASLQDHILTVREFAAGMAGEAALSVKGEVSGLDGEVRFKDVVYGLRAPTPSVLARLAGLDWPMGGGGGKPPPLVMTGVLNGSVDRVTLRSLNETGGAVVGVEGVIDSPLKAPRFEGAAEVRHDDFVGFVNLFKGGYRPKTGNPGGFILQTRVSAATGKGLSLSDLRARLGSMDLAGGARVSIAGGRAKASLELAAGDLDLDRLLPSARPAQASSAGERRPAKTPDPAKASPSRASTGGRWSREPMGLSFLTSFDADLALHAASLVWDGTRVAEPRLGARLADGVLTLDGLTGRIFGGGLEVKGTMNVAAVPRASAVFAVRGADVRQALTKAADFRIAEGSLDLDAALEATGDSVHEMVSSLNGAGEVSVKEGAVQGFDLGAVNRRLADASNPVGLIAGIQAGLNGGTTTFKTIGGTFKAANGLVRTDDLRMVADSGLALATGSVDLPAWTLDGRVEFRLSGKPNAPPLGVRMIGPIDDPRRILDIQGFQTHLLETGARRALKGRVGEVIRELLPPPSGDGAPDPKPKDILKGILNDLARQR